MEAILSIWQECEVSKPNKLVPVPTNLLFRGRGSEKTTIQQQVTMEKLSLKNMLSQNTEESTSAGSGSQRSNEAEEELLLRTQAIQTPVLLKHHSD